MPGDATGEPPAGLSAAQAALWWLRRGGFVTGAEWERAHALAQGAEGSRDADRVHGLVHLIEGDRGNAAYWYRRAGEALPAGDAAAEWQRLSEDCA